jgi:hypothetical protein
VLQRASSTKIQCTSDDGKVLIEENEDEVEKGGDISKRTTQSSCQQESIPPVVPTSNESSETSIESKTSTKVEEQACGTVKAWIKRKLHFFSRKNKSAANDFKNVA